IARLLAHTLVLSFVIQSFPMWSIRPLRALESPTGSKHVLPFSAQDIAAAGFLTSLEGISSLEKVAGAGSDSPIIQSATAAEKAWLEGEREKAVEHYNAAVFHQFLSRFEQVSDQMKDDFLWLLENGLVKQSEYQDFRMFYSL